MARKRGDQDTLALLAQVQWEARSVSQPVRGAVLLLDEESRAP